VLLAEDAGPFLSFPMGGAEKLPQRARLKIQVQAFKAIFT